MAILPIDSGRYGSEKMRMVFADNSRYQFYLDIEAALARVQSRLGIIPLEAGKVLTENANINLITLTRIQELESETKHELVALLKAFAEVSGTYGQYIHLGATSSDILDTSIALQAKQGIDILKGKLKQLLHILITTASKYKTTVMIGRTHGQHALPITFGFKIAVWADEILRHLQRFQQIEERILVGKMSGAVGSMASFKQYAFQIQDSVMEELGLKSADISTQIIPRDRIAELISLLAIVAATLETITTEIRNLQRPEIFEVSEPFDQEFQVGSSAMPHKRNPVNSENVCSLARIVRSLVAPTLENIPLWHERDLTNSACERFTLPEAFILLDEMLVKTIFILGNLRVYPERMRENLLMSKSRIMAEAIMLSLVEAQVGKFDAYSLLRELSAQNIANKDDFYHTLMSNEVIKSHLTPEQVEKLLDESNYIGECETLVDKVVTNCSDFLQNK
ncbi:adenylosuccinate lyase [Tolypothrix sp. NIES-4075]|uniref:adenylosuccinate lyase n=1 Tax=Tolypothrix sp. NIES-4075 TaxID=2005459 RepID=UPI000B5D05C2|nr:adenylosuccinate lyase [Tolypothrix sp. NIES-4075]GAX43011.1 adenylosuccinate lyase [Tolypothrix sp. NIES-4075]